MLVAVVLAERALLELEDLLVKFLIVILIFLLEKEVILITAEKSFRCSQTGTLSYFIIAALSN